MTNLPSDNQAEPKTDPETDIVDLIYEVVAVPERYEMLLDAWESGFGEMRDTRHIEGVSEELEKHAQRAERLLDHYRPSDGPRRGRLEKVSHLPAFIVEANLCVSIANQAAQIELGVLEDIDDEPVFFDRNRQPLTRMMRTCFADGARGAWMLQSALPSGRSGLFHLAIGAEGFAVVTAIGLRWIAELEDQLREIFNLSTTEIEIVRGLFEQRTAAQIAEERGRSVHTVRTQIKGILAKTELRTQTELVATCASLIDITNVTHAAANPATITATDDTGLDEAVCHTLKRLPNRRVEYLVLGDPAGRPVFYLPQDLGLVRWPAAAERDACQRGLRVIVPIRPGYGASDPPPPGADYPALVADDMAALLDLAGAEAAPVLSQAADSCFAFYFGARHPGRCTGIVAAAGNMPFSRPEQFARMHKWHRFIIANARFAPQILPFMVKSGFILARQIGNIRFARAMYGASPSDLAAIADPAIQEAFVVGSQVTRSSQHSAHDAFAREAIEKVQDWSPAVKACADIPCTMFWGDDDPQVSLETVAEWQTEWPTIRSVIIKDAGQLMFFQHWHRILDEVEALLPD